MTEMRTGKIISEEKRIYVVLPKTVWVKPPSYQWIYGFGAVDASYEQNLKQVPGRQIAQAAHVVSKLRHELLKLDKPESEMTINELLVVATQRTEFVPITTIILEARNQKEMMHLFTCLTGEGKQPTLFQDENPAAYGDVKPITAMAVYATPLEVENTLGYLPLWDAQ